MYCRKCGNELPENAAFCGKCGAPVTQKNVGAENLNKKNKADRKKVLGCVVIAGVVLMGLILAVVIGITKRPVMDEIETDAQVEAESMEESQEEIRVVTTKSMNPSDYQWLMTRTDTYEGENNFLGCSIYAYSATNKQIKWEMFNADYSLNTRQEDIYDNLDRILQSQTWDSEGNRIKKGERIYEGDFAQPEEVVWYKEDGSIQYSNRYSYHPEYDKVDIVWEYNADGEEVNYKEFSFDEDGNYTGYRYCYPDGSLYETCAYTYDEAGNMVATEKFDKDNEIKETNSYQYIDRNEVSYQKWNGEEELLVWNTMEYDHAGNEIVRYYYNADRELLNTVLSTYEPVWDCNAVSVESENGKYLFESQSPIEEFCLWFGQEKINTVNADGTIVETENERFPITARITINETDTCTVEIASVMEKLSFEEGITVNSIKLEILDEAGNPVSDENLLPDMYLFGEFEEIAEIEAESEEEPQYYLAKKSKYRDSRLLDEWEYDSAGNETNHWEYDYDGMVIEREEKTYDSAGNLINYVEYDENGEVKWNYTIENTYDNAGKLINTVEYGSDGEVRNRTENTYDNAGKLISIVRFNRDGEVNERKEYDSAGNLIKYATDSFLQEYIYDSAGNRISEYHEYHYIEYDDYGNESSTVSTGNIEYKYDSTGNLIRMDQYWDRGVTYVEEYDSNGNPIYSCENSDDGKLESRYEYQYDDKGRIIEKRSYGETRLEWERQNLLEMAFGGDWSKVNYSTEEYYKYDDNGNLIEEEKVYSDDSYSLEGDSPTHEKIVYEYQIKVD